MDAVKLQELKQFINTCKSDPSILSDPSLSFFRDYLESVGAKLPSSAYKSESKPHVVEESDEEVEEPQEEEEDEIVESDIEFEGETVEPDNDPPQKMGDSSVEVSEENRDASQEAKAKGMEAISDGKLEEAIEHLTEAILLNPTSAIMYATRATVYIKMKKPNAAIRDADAALKINPDSAKGYKSRGIARSLLGQWEEAAKDLHVASNIDFDEEISSILKKVEPNAHKIVEHRRKYDKLRKEREDRKTERERQRRKAEAKAIKEEKASSSERVGGMLGGFPGGMPGGFPGGGMPGGPASGGFPGGGMPGMPGGGSGGGGGMPGGIDYNKMLNDPELMAEFQNPEVMAALQDVMDIDSVGTFTMCHTALNYLKKGGPGRSTDDTGGLILNISATLHYTASWYQIHVSAAKAVVDAITRNFALEWGTDYDIRVNGIAPGPISDTPGMRKLGPDEIESKRTKQVMPLFKLGEKSDIAFAALYLTSNAGNNVNGTTLIVDGGLWLSRPRHMAKDEVKMISRLVEKRTRAAPSSKL